MVNEKKNEGSTPLHFAAMRNARVTAELLLKQEGIDVNARDNEYRTPLYWAEKAGSNATAELLRRYGGKIS